MIGGIVIESIALTDKVWINTVDNDESRNERCAIFVERNEKSEKIKAGDSLWWQGGFAMWTPYRQRGGQHMEGTKCGVDYDIRISRIGCSGVSKPCQ